jgi:hypothetical protein
VYRTESAKLVRIAACGLLLAAAAARPAEADVIEISSVKELADYAARSGNQVRMKPGVYRVADYLTADVIAAVRAEVPPGPGRPPVWMIRFSGSDNTFDLRGVTLEIDTSLYPRLPRGYMRCLFVPGSNNSIDGLTIRNTGPEQGSGGNILSIWGKSNRVENVTLYVRGSKTYGYGDLFGKGGPSLAPMQKQSGIMVAGEDHIIRRCKVISRAFGHCFYVQKPEGMTTRNVGIEDCYAEGEMRSTSDMLRDTTGPGADIGFRSVYANRDGRHMITSGYMKALCEDGFRTYGGVENVTLLNCTAVNTRAGFEIGGTDEASVRTIIDGGTALGCERAYLIGSNVTVRQSRGDVRYGPLLYLRGGRGADVDLELVGEGSDYTVHALATIAGEDHRVRLYTNEHARHAPSLPIMLGFGMPDSAEMSSPIRPARTANVRLSNELPRMPVIRGAEAADCTIETSGMVLSDEDSQRLPPRPTTKAASTGLSTRASTIPTAGSSTGPARPAK